MDMSIDVKCAVTTAILSVLVYLLLITILRKTWTDVVFGKEMNESEWYTSMEILMLIAVFIAFNLNNYLFTSCRSA